MRRRDILAGAGSIVTGISLSFPAPAIAQGIRELKMVTAWPRNSPGLQTSAERLARSITAMSDGHLKVTVYPDDTLVRAFEVFDAVAAGVADMYHSSDYYFGAKSPALNFFASVPFGLTADELCAWINFGGGQGLWDEVDAQFNIKPLMALNTGEQMGGWYNKEVNHPQDYKGLRYRMPGLGDEVLRPAGFVRRGPVGFGSPRRRLALVWHRRSSRGPRPPRWNRARFIPRRRTPGPAPGGRGVGPGRGYSGCWRPSWTGRGPRRSRRWRAPRSAAGRGSRGPSGPCR